jgi:hypothetical protein
MEGRQLDVGEAMSRFVCSVMVVAAGLAVIAAPVSAAPDEDFVVGSGEVAVLFPGFPPVVVGVTVEAHVTLRAETRPARSLFSSRPTAPCCSAAR